MGGSPTAALLDPAILFFFFGLFAGFVRSNLAVPAQVAKFLSLYLLMALGFKGGVSLSQSGFNLTMGLALLCAVLLALVIPLYTFALLRKRLNVFDAAAIAATYGSVSAVTFLTANAFLESKGISAGGYMTVALVLMETPAIIMAVLFANLARREQGQGSENSTAPIKILHESLTDGAQLLLLGSLMIGYLTGDNGKKIMDPFTGQILKGMLAFFLLDMGLLVAARVRELNIDARFLGVFALLAPLMNASLATLFAYVVGLGLGDAFLLLVLAASASYIVVPAVVRYAIPEANAGLYFGMSLGITFPFNLTIGLPLYFAFLTKIWS